MDESNATIQVSDTNDETAENTQKTVNVDDTIAVGKKRKKEKEIEDYLHKINVDQVLRETGLDMDGLCKLIGVDYQTVNRWKFGKERNGNRPKYNAIIRLLRHGATQKTLFGVDPPDSSSNSNKIVLTDDLVAEMLVRAGRMLEEKKDGKQGNSP